jgi:hypothetical protein
MRHAVFVIATPHIRPVHALAIGLVLLLVGPGVVASGVAAVRELQPLIVGSERFFSVTWDAARRHGQLEVEGDVNNNSPYRVGNLRLLVDSLDDTGRIVDQRLSWVIGELGANDRLYFEVPVSPAARYRVRVFSYDRIDEAGLMVP